MNAVKPVGVPVDIGEIRGTGGDTHASEYMNPTSRKSVRGQWGWDTVTLDNWHHPSQKGIE